MAEPGYINSPDGEVEIWAEQDADADTDALCRSNGMVVLCLCAFLVFFPLSSMSRT